MRQWTEAGAQEVTVGMKNFVRMAELWTRLPREAEKTAFGISLEMLKNGQNAE